MRLVILDTGTLGLLTHPRARPDALACRQWAQTLLVAAARVIVPGIADYELRRELIRAHKTAGLRRLDAVRAGFEFDPITQVALDKAAELWAAVRNAGLTTAHPAALDGDAILAAHTILGLTRATSSRLPRTTPVIFPDSPGSMRGTGRRSRLDGLSVRRSSSKGVGIRALLSQPQNVGTDHLAQSPWALAPATQRPAGIPSRTIYGLIAYLCQIAGRIRSDPFDPR